MFSMIKIGFVVVALGTVVLVPSTIRDWLEARYDAVIELFKKDTPDSQFVKKAERELAATDGRLKEMSVGLARLSDQLATLKAETKKEEDAIAGIVADLQECKKKATCGGLTSGETEQLRARTDRGLHDLRIREQVLAAKREQLVGVEKAWKDATKALEDARQTRDKMRAELESVKTRLKAAGVRREANKVVAEAANPVHTDELTRTMEELRERARTAEREADFYSQEVRPTLPMPATERDLRPLADQIDEALKRSQAGRAK
jgi:chromosome segregation ATPase